MLKGMHDREEAPSLLIIADDLTGANDSGVQFAKRGIRSVVVIGPFEELIRGYEVVVVNTESRHVSEGVAVDRVRRAVEAGLKRGVQHFFKKTDSTLRGNIGAELRALMEATGERTVPFVPAFPEMGRITRGGIHFVHGVRIGDSEFAHDPRSPVQESDVAKLLRRSGLAASSEQLSGLSKEWNEGCVVCDCESRGEMRQIADRLAQMGRLQVLAGSAGFLEELPRVLSLPDRGGIETKALGPVLLVNGSLNPRALEQAAAARDVDRVRMPPDYLLGLGTTDEFETLVARFEDGGKRDVLLYSVHHRDETAEFVRLAREAGHGEGKVHALVADNTGKLVRDILHHGHFQTLVVFGGDTLMGIAKACGWAAFVPRTEVGPGVTVANPLGSDLTVISKAGGFGETGVVGRILSWVRRS